MKYPGRNSTYEIVELCLQNLIKVCEKESIEKVGLPALGTGVGGLKKQKVAELYVSLLAPLEHLTFVVCDRDQEFMGALQGLLTEKTQK